jgi:cobalamin biosynthesis Mg chelatase CobN
MVAETQVGKGAPTEQLLSSVLDFHLQATPAPSKEVRRTQLRMGWLCVIGAFAVAAWLVAVGPPAPNSDEASETTATPGTSGVALVAAPQEGASGAESEGEAPSGTENEQPEGESPGDEPSESGSAPEESESDTTSSLNEEAPWVFVIVALVVGAFLAAGQSLGFGGSKGAVEQPPATGGDQGKDGNEGAPDGDKEPEPAKTGATESTGQPAAV